MKDIHQACAALVLDLKQRGLLDSTLVIWGDEFGRTPTNEARNGRTYLGRDNHPHAFGMWLAGGGINKGYVHGTTDELGYHVTEGKVTIRDLQATMLHLLGIDPYTFSYKYQGVNNRLIGPVMKAKSRKRCLRRPPRN